MKLLFSLLILSLSYNSFACECECSGICDFKTISTNMEFVILVKVISYDDYLNNSEDDIMGYNKNIPNSMIVEVIKKYKGVENRTRIKIWGDNGAQCRPYIANFKLNNYYLMSPNYIENSKGSVNELKTDYELSSCITSYLEFDFEKKVAYGDFTKEIQEISLKDFEDFILKK